MAFFITRFQSALKTAFLGQEKKWAAASFLITCLLATYMWYQGVWFRTVLAIGYFTSAQFIVSSLNSAWHGGLFDESQRFVQQPTAHSWSYFLVDAMISLVYFLAIFPTFMDVLTVYIACAAIIAANAIQHVWKYRDQIFAKAA